MIISYQHKFIFVKTRKTAGSSIERYLVDNYLGPGDICTGSPIDGTPRLNTESKDGHMSWADIKAKYPAEWPWNGRGYFKFAVERNPWDKLVSMYWHYKRWRPSMVENGFEDFLDRFIDDCNDWDRYAHGDQIKVDALIDYSKLHQSLRELPVPYNDELLSVFMKSDTRQNHDYREMYTADTKRSVEQVFCKPIQHFGYIF